MKRPIAGSGPTAILASVVSSLARLCGPDRPRSVLALAAGLGILIGMPAARAQTPWWDQPDARAEARRSLEAIEHIMETSERGDARPAAAALTDPAWIVRLLAAIRLEVTGLDQPTAEALKADPSPARPVPAADWAPLKRARDYAQALEVELGAPVEIGPNEALRIAASLVTERVRNGPDEPAAKRRMMEGLMSWRAALEKAEDRAWLARRLLGLSDLDQALADLAARSPERAVEEGGQKVYDWFAANTPYFYWHPVERRFRVDLEARSKRVPSAELRQGTPWGPQEGPNSPAKTTEPGR